MRPRSGSLLVRLSWRLILLQLLALTLVVVVASIPERDRRDLRELDRDALTAAAAHLVLEDGRLTVSAEFAAALADHPEFWLLARDARGREGGYGPAPDWARLLFEESGAPLHAEIHWGESGSGAAIAQRMASPLGEVAILTGGGPTLDPVISRLQRIDPWYLLLLIGLTTVSALAIPWLLRKDLRGVDQVAAEAARIDVDQPGARLTEAKVPPELQGMVRAMNAALTRLDEGLEKRKRFLATAAHELRTPLAVLTLRLELLPPGPERSRLRLDAARLSALADQLLDLQRMEADHAPFLRVDLRGLIGEAAAEIAPLAVACGADLAFEAPPEPVEILADAQAIRRVAVNLIQNAVVHGGAGVSILAAVSRPAELRVRDDGPGVAPEDRAQIFEPFFRRSQAGGSGLGLHLVQEIVARHGGTISAEEAPGGGLEFVVRFPPAP